MCCQLLCDSSLNGELDVALATLLALATCRGFLDAFKSDSGFIIFIWVFVVVWHCCRVVWYREETHRWRRKTRSTPVRSPSKSKKIPSKPGAIIVVVDFVTDSGPSNEWRSYESRLRWFKSAREKRARAKQIPWVPPFVAVVPLVALSVLLAGPAFYHGPVPLP
jgi:hypothetical protein